SLAASTELKSGRNRCDSASNLDRGRGDNRAAVG
ncbi:hypothetical protein L915_14648, partial [Phytophthora nicotianae]